MSEEEKETEVSGAKKKCFDAKRRLLIAGSRGIDNIDISEYIPDDVDLIISGGAKGVDTLAEQYADKHRISKIILRPDYAHFGRNAPLMRNMEMINISTDVLIFWDGKSRGTKYTIDCAKEGNKLLKIVRVDKEA